LIPGAYGTGLGWLHDVSVAFYCWIYSAKQAEIDVILHECVPNFDPSVLEQCLWPDYIGSSMVWSAADEGLPIRRERRYSLCIRKTLGPSLLSFNDLTWSSLIFCNRVVTASIFFQASADHIDGLRHDLCDRKRFPQTRIRSTGEPGKWAWEVLMSRSERDVLLAMRKKANEYAKENPSMYLSKKCWLLNLSQSLSFQPKCGQFELSVIPALLRSSKFFIDFYDTKKSRFVHPLECMAMQGLPVLLPPDHFAHQVCNFEETLKAAGISFQKMAALSGNGMNLSSVGQVLFFALATV
jgi:hypothetical protein